MNTFVFTCGDPNGIGPEIVIKTITKVLNRKDRFIIVSPKNLFNKYSSFKKIKSSIQFAKDADELSNAKPGSINILEVRGGNLSPGKPTKTSGKISFESLQTATTLVQKIDGAALITAPISKEAWGLNNIKYEGHTDYLGEKFNCKNPLMLFYSLNMIAGLVTIHKPIKLVTKSITDNNVYEIIKAVGTTLKRDFNKANYKIAVLGLNPHAGENGRIGQEEIKIINPVIKEFKNVYGPFVPDAFFGQKLYKQYDAVIGMYHDQVLIPFKLLNFDKGVNFTANLPIVRTSPDHGTAFDIAQKNIADSRSMIESYKLAKRVLKNRR